MAQEREPLVTVVSITFNLIKAKREAFFRQCLGSVHNQTYKNIEHIVIDGASTDGTVELIKEYAEKGWVKYISEPDKGIYDAMNKGIGLASGKYIAFLNSDDYYHNPNAIGLSIKSLERKGADFSYADFIALDNENKRIVKGDIETFFYTMPFGHPTMFTKTSAIKAANGFDTTYKVIADYDLIIRLILMGCKGVYIDEDITTYRLGGICCTMDYSEDVVQIYLKNYGQFYTFSDANQAKNILYELVIPKDFPDKFREYAVRKNLKNINIDAMVSHLEKKISERSHRLKPRNSSAIKTILFSFLYILNRMKLIDSIKIYPFGFSPYLKVQNKQDVVRDSTKNEDGNIPVFLSSDNNFAPFIATTVCSIMENTQSFVDFYILDGGVSELNKQKIKEISRQFANFSIEFIRIDTQKEFYNFPTRVHFSLDMFTRYLIPQLKPHLNKVIYSDVDVIFNGDIKDLYEEKLNGFIIGAVPYTFGYLNPNSCEIEEFHKRLNLSNEHKYFESGLLLIDGGLWRKNNITDKLIEKAKECKNIILTPDQDAFNLIFENKYQQLDNKYIVVPHRNKIMSTDIQAKKSVDNPFIYHYAGANKPWNNASVQCAEYFWKYARRTPFYDELIFKLIMSSYKNRAFNVILENFRRIKFAVKVKLFPRIHTVLLVLRNSIHRGS